jgi:hypothetical protein
MFWCARRRCRALTLVLCRRQCAALCQRTARYGWAQQCPVVLTRPAGRLLQVGVVSDFDLLSLEGVQGKMEVRPAARHELKPVFICCLQLTSELQQLHQWLALARCAHCAALVRSVCVRSRPHARRR